MLVEPPSTQQVVDRLCIMKQVFENRDGSWSLIDDILLAWNSGASLGLRPFCDDFLDQVDLDIPVKDVTKVNKVVDIGNAVYKFKMITEMM